MGSDNFTGIVSFICKEGNTTIIKYTIIYSQCPENFDSIKHFKSLFDVNELNWSKSKTKIYECAQYKEKIYHTKHGIIEIDYTKEEPLENRIMFSSEYKKLITIKNLLYNCFNVILHLLYLLFIIKLIHNLYY